MKKSKASKRLRFEEPSEEYVFKPRRPITRRQMKEAEKVHKEEATVKMPITEFIEILTKTVHAAKSKDKSKKVIISQGGNVIAIKNQAGKTQEEVAQTKSFSRERAMRYASYRRAVLKGSTSLLKQAGSGSDVFSWMVLELKQAKLIRKMNMSLRSENKALKKEVSSLKEKLGKLAH